MVVAGLRPAPDKNITGRVILYKITRPFYRCRFAIHILEHFNFKMLYIAWHFKRQKTQPFIIHVQAEAA